MIKQLAKSLSDRIIPPLIAAVADEIQKHIPALVRAVVVAVTQTMTSMAEDTAGHVTDAIPGEADDVIVAKVFDVLHRWGF